ncbi:hypothetical protein [Paenibacillus sp. FSL R10-2771]|uniref:hypothetical protein n=1 Tax=Paenibacillus sp. FSL R10-2771 TaxID=2954693 RepID=UPI0030F51DD8
MMIAIKRIRGVLLMFLCALLVFMTLLTVRPQVTYACSCVIPAPPLEALEDSAAVFEGTVISVAKPSGIIQSSADPMQVTFQVGARWKGDLGNQVTVSTAQSGDSCGFEFAEGERYMVYARGAEADGNLAKGNEEQSELTTSLCSRTALYADAQEDLNELGPGTGGGSPTAPPETAEGDAPSVPVDNHSATAPWLLYVGAGAGMVILIALGLTWQRRQSNKSRK